MQVPEYLYVDRFECCLTCCIFQNNFSLFFTNSFSRRMSFVLAISRRWQRERVAIDILWRPSLSISVRRLLTRCFTN